MICWVCKWLISVKIFIIYSRIWAQWAISLIEAIFDWHWVLKRTLWTTCDPHVWDPWSNTTKQKKQDHTSLFSKLAKQTKHQWWSRKTWSWSPFWESRSRRSRLGLEGFRSGSQALSLETLHRLLFMNFFQDCSKYSRSKGQVAKLSLLCYLRDGENNLPSTPFKIYIEFSKNVYVPMKLQRIVSETRRWEYFVKDYLWTVFPGVLLWNPYAYSKEVGKCQKISLLRSQIKRCLFSKCFSKHSVETRWWSFFCSA